MRTTTAGRIAAITGGVALVAGSTLALAGPAFSAPNAEVKVTADQLAQTATPYTGWHEGYETPAAHATITDAGLNLTGKSQIINGLPQVLHVDGTSQSFADIVAGVDFTSTNDAVHYQLPIFANAGSDGTDGAAGTGFTTLRPAVPGVEGLSGDWVSSRDITPEAPSTPTPTPTPTETFEPQDLQQKATPPAGDDELAPTDKPEAPATDETDVPSEPAAATSGFTVKLASAVKPRLAADPQVILANTPYSVEEITAALGSFDILAFGVLAADGISDTVQTISFEGTTYRFNAVAPVESPSPTPTATTAAVKKLSNTGANTTPLLIGGAILLIGGTAAMALGSKARRKQA
ncbi:hypothetical protein ACL9RL_03645 [Plantibacter sp. Mn2098]|uniref:hypothetical protein n=1 Tax=Plantibacter sp. Mn2098 TaxID=3395266 RepID=UPI003BE666B4